MKNILKYKKNNKFNAIFLIFKLIGMLLLTYLYILYVDMSTAPEFIYNQF